MRTRVKICGITRRQDAEIAIESGADALGLVFYGPSPRAVSIAQAHEICEGLPPFVSVVGLFVNATARDVQSCLDALRIDCLQFHGDETPDYCESFRRPYMKAIRMQPGIDLKAQATRFQSASALLLDSYQAGVPGGTGRTFDWTMIDDIGKTFILAGGLNADNVASAIQQVKPYAVDVSGGVEISSGLKSQRKISAFMQEVGNA